MKRLLRIVFLENIGLKLVALALAFVLFLYVQGERKRDTVTGALVKLTLVPPPGKVLTVDPVNKLAVTLRGPRSAIRRMMAEGIEPIEIDLRDRRPGVLHFTSDMIQVPRGLVVESIQPPQVDVAWDDRVVKRVPIVPRIAGKPQPGYRVAAVRVEPREAEVTGARSVVDAIAEVELREVRVDGRDRSAELSVPVSVGRKFVKVFPEQARVFVEIRADLVTRRFTSVEVRVLNHPADVEVQVSPRRAAQVLLEGPARVLSRLERRDLQVTIDLADLGHVKSGSYARPGRVDNLPEGTRLVAMVPASFSVSVRGRGGADEEGP